MSRVLLMTTLLLCALPTAAQSLDSAGYWPFDGDGLDVTGHANHAAAMLDATFTFDRFGRSQAAALVGWDAWFEAADSAFLDVSGDFAIAFWMRQDGIRSFFNCLAGKDYTTSFGIGPLSGGSDVCPDPGADRWMRLFVGFEPIEFTNGPRFDCGTGQWTHVVVIWDQGLQAADLYVNGAFADSQSVTATLGTSGWPLGIGRDGRSLDTFTGAIDDLHLFDRAVTADEALSLSSAVFADGFELGATSRWVVR